MANGVSKDIAALLRQAHAQGFESEYTGSDHIRIVAPKGTAGPDGKNVTVIANTPSSQRALQNARSQLIRIGYIPPERAQTKKKQQKKEGSDQVARLGDIAKVKFTSPDKSSTTARLIQKGRRDVMPSKQIKDDVQLAAWVVWDEIMTDIKNTDPLVSSTLRGLVGYTWTGSRQQVISRIWPDLEKPDYNATPKYMPEERRLIAAYLNHSKNMAPLKPGDAKTLTVWWVNKNWNDVAVDLQRVATQSNWWETKVTPDEAGENRPPLPVITTYQCPDCCYRTAKPAGLAVHKARMKYDEHPNDETRCPVTGCVEIRGSLASIYTHLRNDHSDTQVSKCRRCDAVFIGETARSMLLKHAKDVHKDDGRPGLRAQIDPLTLAKQTDSGLIVPQAAPSADPFAYLQGLLTEVQQLREAAASVPGLEQRLAELEEENSALRDRDTILRDWLSRYPFK